MEHIPSSFCWAAVPGILLLAACHREAATPPGPAPAKGRPTVLVDNYPLLYFTQRLAGDAADVGLPAPREVDPAFWKPDEAAIRRYQAADLILLNGASYAKWTEQVSLPQAKLVDTSRAFAKDYITIEDSVVHRHGPGGQHAHQGVAFTTWLDPRQATQQAQAIRDALARLLPDLAGQIEPRFQGLKTDLEKLDARLSEILQGQPRQPLLASHPVYQYLARRCQWDLQSVHWEPEELPDDAQWQSFAELLAKHPAQWMLWEAPPRPEVTDKLTQIGVACVVFYPCANVPDAGDYLQVMQQNIDRLGPLVRHETKPHRE
jgi:zinc transport system substrate-binding protein